MSTTATGAVVHAYAALPTGVHAIDLERAIEMIRHAPAEPRANAGGAADGAAPTPLVWIDVSNPGEAEAAILRDRCGFHPLAVEDCIRGRQRPKIDRYADFLFLVLYVASINPERHRMALNEIHIFLGERYIVTVHDHKVSEVSEIVARWRASPQHFTSTGWLAYALLDEVVDDYFPVLEHFAERAEQVENAIFERLEAPGMQQILLLRHQLILFRRAVVPGRDVLSSLLRRDVPFLQPELLPYFQDVHDHTIRVTEGIDAMRELLSGALEAHLTVASNRLNQTVRMLTAWSIILMSMALVAGVYGMNFVAMPELEWRWGYYAALGLMAAVGGGLVTFFRRRGWL
jgi:magnesium transporter